MPPHKVFTEYIRCQKALKERENSTALCRQGDKVKASCQQNVSRLLCFVNNSTIINYTDMLENHIQFYSAMIIALIKIPKLDNYAISLALPNLQMFKETFLQHMKLM